MSALPYLSIQKLQKAYESGETDPVEITRACLDQIKASSQNAWITVAEKRALDQAEGAKKLLEQNGSSVPSDYPLLGVPVGVKDILTVKDTPTTCASRLLKNYVPPYTATTVERMEAAGAISLGKLNMDEFAMGSSNENSAFGAVKHPTHPDRVPGGSSGGSACSVKASHCLASLGSDTGGSIRLPASFCGVVGVKPTYGRMSRYGLVAFASSLDQVGPFTRSVEDAARFLEVMAGFDPKDSTSVQVERENWVDALQQSFQLKGLKIGVPDEYFVEGMDPDVENGVREALNWYQSQGAELVPISLPHTEYAIATYYVVAVSEASSNLARYDGVRYGFRPPEADEVKQASEFYEKVRAYFGSEVKRRIILGTFSLSSGYYEAYYKRACQVRRLIKQDFDRAFQKVDVIASPVGPSTAFPLGERVQDPIKMYLTDVCTIPANLAGLPAMSLPCGEDQKGLPVGLQLIGAPFQEKQMLQTAQAYERSSA